jgi:hypothetical protein
MNRIKYILLFITCSTSFISAAQKTADWDQLTGLTYRWQFSAEYETWYEKPMFNSYMTGLEGKEVTVKGFIIPLDAPNNKFFVSMYPNSTCFFCNKAGKETVVQLHFVNQQTFDVDDVVILKGTFKINAIPFEMPFALENAKLVKKISQ